MKAVLMLPLVALARVRPHPRIMENVYALEKRYRMGLAVAPIPIRMNIHGQLNLARDGNHRLAAARRAGLKEVAVVIDARDAAKLRSRYGAR